MAVAIAAVAAAVFAAGSIGTTAGALDTSFGGDGKVVLDASFGGEGKVVTSLTGGSDWASALAIQADGKIVIAGGGVVARYSSDGTLDTSFSGDGKVITGFSAEGVAIQADGKIVVVGTGRGELGVRLGPLRQRRHTRLELRRQRQGEDRLQRTGVGVGWRQRGGHPGGRQDRRRRLLRHSLSPHFIQHKFALARYTADGKLDATFGRNGKVETDFTGRGGAAYGVAIQADGKIVVVGDRGRDRPRPLQQRRHARRELRTQRQGRGPTSPRAVTRAQGWPSRRTARSSPSAWRASTAATAGSPWLATTATARLDASFGVNGKVRTTFSVKGAASVRILADAAASGVAIQADGKIVAAGRRGTIPMLGDSDSRFALARYNSDGTLDASFGVNGKVETDFTALIDKATGVAIQADGRIVAAGIANLGVRSKAKVALARYLGQ